jgi:multiple sugar transport system substrate-binding protein
MQGHRVGISRALNAWGEKNYGHADAKTCTEGVGRIGGGGSAGFVCRPAVAAVPELKCQPEKGATLRMLRWKRTVQEDEDQWQDNTRKFFECTGVTVNIEILGLREVFPKAAMAAGVGAGPDLVLGDYDMPQLYPDKCDVA